MVVDTIGPEVFFRHQLFPIRFHVYTQRFSLFSVYISGRLIDSGIGFRICSNSQLCFNNQSLSSQIQLLAQKSQQSCPVTAGIKLPGKF